MRACLCFSTFDLTIIIKPHQAFLFYWFEIVPVTPDRNFTRFKRAVSLGIFNCHIFVERTPSLLCFLQAPFQPPPLLFFHLPVVFCRAGLTLNHWDLSRTHSNDELWHRLPIEWKSTLRCSLSIVDYCRSRIFFSYLPLGFVLGSHLNPWNESKSGFVYVCLHWSVFSAHGYCSKHS